MIFYTLLTWGLRLLDRSKTESRHAFIIYFYLLQSFFFVSTSIPDFLFIQRDFLFIQRDDMF